MCENVDYSNTVLKLSDPALGQSLEVLESYMQAREKLGYQFDTVAQQLIDAFKKCKMTYIHVNGKGITIGWLIDYMNSGAIEKSMESSEPIDLDKLFCLGEIEDHKTKITDDKETNERISS